MGIIMDDFYFEDSNPKHVFLKCLLILFIIGLCIGAFLFYKNKNTMKLKKVYVELGSELSNDVNDYLVSGVANSSNYKLDLSMVDKDVIGEYTYKVRHNKNTKKGTLVVRDTTKPVIETSNIVMNKEETLDLNFIVTSCKDYSLPCSVSFVNKSDVEKLGTVGEYTIPFYIQDNVGNKVKKDIEITVSDTEYLSTKMSNDLEYYTNSINDDSIEHVYFEKFDKALEDESDDYVTTVQEISALDFSEYTDGEIYNSQLITVYNKYGYVTGIQVLVTYVDGTKELLTK